MKHQELVSQELIHETDSLSQSGFIKSITAERQVQFPQDNGKYTNILIYGSPYLENGIWFIDFKIWSRDWGSENLIHDRDSILLRRFTLEQFLKVGKTSFISELRQQRIIIQLEIEPNLYDMYFFKDISNDSEFVIVESFDRKLKSAYFRNIIRSLFYVDKRAKSV